jgi:hypothetical protein
MTSMMSSRRNRGVTGIDDPWDDDGFYAYRQFKTKNKAKAGKRPWRRAVRTLENRIWKKEVQNEF